jgi:hypothetical protein
MTFADVMTKDPSCCVPTDSAARLAKIMKTQNVARFRCAKAATAASSSGL